MRAAPLTAIAGENKNPMPTDEVEQDRLDLQHEMLLSLLGNKLYLAPIAANPQKILDVGTGTGIWAIDMADRFPSAEVIGTDLSPIQPTWVPPNWYVPAAAAPAARAPG